MSTLSWMLLLLAGGVAWRRMGRRPGATRAAANGTRRIGAAGALAELGAPGQGAHSPNAAERLCASHAHGVGAGIGQAWQDSGRSQRLFDTHPKTQDEEIVPGLPDQFRGA